MQTTILSLLIACSMLNGCSTLMPPSQITLPPIPPSLTTDCQVLPALATNSVDALVDMLIEVSGMYYECAARHRDLANAAAIARSPKKKE